MFNLYINYSLLVYFIMHLIILFTAHIGISILLSVLVTVVVMWLREASRKEKKEAEKEEEELMEALATASDLEESDDSEL